MASELIVTKTNLEAHLSAVIKTINSSIAETEQVELVVDWGVDPITAGLDGVCCETVDRMRGRTTKAARLADLKHGLWAWLGYREEWDSAPPAGSTARFSFRTCSLTIFVGYANTVPKPQVFRLEWAGYVKHGQGYGFQGGSAAHPHWQVDLTESLAADTADQARELAAVLREEARVHGPQDFSPSQVTEKDIKDVISARRFSRMHLANGANWWVNSPSHQKSPDSLMQITNWLRHALQYTVLELARL